MIRKLHYSEHSLACSRPDTTLEFSLTGDTVMVEMESYDWSRGCERVAFVFDATPEARAEFASWLRRVADAVESGSPERTTAGAETTAGEGAK